MGRCFFVGTPRACLSGFGNFVGLGGLVLEETEGGVALAEDARLQEAAETLGQLDRAPVLGDYDAAKAEKGSVAEKTEDAIVLRFFCVRGVDEGEIEGRVGGSVSGGEFFEGAEGIEGKDLGFALDFERGEIAED